MDDEELIERLSGLAEGFGYAVRMEPLGGDGGACILGGKKMLFVDAVASREVQIETFARALIEEDLDTIYIIPQVRETIERLGRALG